MVVEARIDERRKAGVKSSIQTEKERVIRERG